MTLTLEMITFDTVDAPRLAAWWAEQTGGTVHDENEGWFVVVVHPDGGPRLGFQKVEDPTPGKNRVHLDLHPDDAVTAIEGLLRAGATRVADHEEGSLAWTVLADPDGNQFCVSRG